MMRRTEFEPMSITATGGPRSRRPGARSRLPPLGALALANEAAGEGVFKRFSTARQAWIGHEILVRIERLLAGHRLYAGRSAIRQEFPTLLIVLEIGDHDLIKDLGVHRWIEHGAEHLDAPVEVARHKIGGGNVDGGFRMGQRMPPAEAIDAPVLEEATDDRFHSDALREARDAGAQAADAADHEIDFDAGARCRIERIDDLGVDERVHLHPDRGRAS